MGGRMKTVKQKTPFETQDNHEEAVVVGMEVRKHGRTRVREDRYRKSRGFSRGD